MALNNAVDLLLKKEFDRYRSLGTQHPLIEAYGVDAIPAQHPDLAHWRYNFTGIEYRHEPSNFLLVGALDDLWQNSNGDYHVVDYKTIVKEDRVTDFAALGYSSYKRQLEFYSWLLRRRGLSVSKLGFLVFCNAQTQVLALDGKLTFEMTLVPCQGDDAWVEPSVMQAHACLQAESAPLAEPNCPFCSYVAASLKQQTTGKTS